MALFTTTLSEGDDTLVFKGVDLFDIPWTINALGGNDSITINGAVVTSGGGDWTICNLGDGTDYARVNGGGTSSRFVAATATTRSMPIHLPASTAAPETMSSTSSVGNMSASSAGLVSTRSTSIPT